MSGQLKWLEAGLTRLSRALLVLGAASVLVMTALVVLASIMRYAVGSPFRFTEELVALLYAAMMFLTIPLCTIKNQHIGMNLVVEMAGPGARRILRLLACLVTLAFTIWFIVESWKFSAFAQSLGSRTEQVDLLLWPWMALMPGSMLVVALFVSVQTVQASLAVGCGSDLAQTDEIAKDPF
jgi:TRAP-type C4-dicarboxylate transport system permease small subunit